MVKAVYIKRAQFQAPQDINTKPASISQDLDFTTAETYEVQFDQTSGGSVGNIKSVIINNSNNPSDLNMLVTGTNQKITAPANSIGSYVVASWPTSVFEIDSAGGGGNVNITFNNFPVQQNVSNVATSSTVLGKVTAVGSAADGTPPNDYPVLIAGSDGTNTQTIKTNASGAVEVVFAGSLPISQAGAFKEHIFGAASTLVKTGAGTLNGIYINTPIANATVTVRDGTDASGAVIGKVTLPATLLNQGPSPKWLEGISFATGLFIETTGANLDVTVIYQ